MNLCQVVDVIENNNNVVVLMVKENMRLALASLKGFDGTESIIRVAKGNPLKISVYSKMHLMAWVDGCDMPVSRRYAAMGKAIRECLEVDFGIHIGTDSEQVAATLRINKLDVQSARLRRAKNGLTTVTL